MAHDTNKDLMDDLVLPIGFNLGSMIASHVDMAQPWLVEVGSDGGERTFSYGDLHLAAAGMARLLQDRDLAPKARIGIIGFNSAEYLLTYYGIMQSGYCAVPIGYKLPKESIEHILDEAQVELLFADSSWATQLDGKVPILSLDDHAEWWGRLNKGPFKVVQVQTDDFATILYTSGSSGTSKGVPLTHGGYIWSLSQSYFNGGEFIHRTAARVLTGAPLSHMNALFLIKMVAAYGGTVVLMTQFNARTFLEICARNRCSMVTGVPAMLALCAQETELIRRLDLNSVQKVSVGSAPVTDSLFDKIGSTFPNAIIKNGWGTTETGPAVFGPHPRGLATPPTSVGYPLPSVEVHLEGESRHEGELYVRNGAIMPGYLNNKEETQKRLIKGWYRTGDIMCRDSEGFFYFVSRSDDMFVCGGENMYPNEIEFLLEKHPDVLQAAVVPVPDEIKGHVPAAFIVRRAQGLVGENEIKQFALTNGPVYQYPRFVIFINEMPLSATNKIDKNRIKEMSSRLGR
jgi:acyl-CoA synthetase (AMP-forming)/AMP-acid ligase II